MFLFWKKFWKKSGWWLAVGCWMLGTASFGWTQERMPLYSPLPGGYMETSYNGAVPPLNRENEQTIGEILASENACAESPENPYHISQEKGISPGNVRSVPVIPARYYESNESASFSQTKSHPSGVQQASHIVPTAPAPISAPAPQVLPQEIPQGDLGQNQNGIIAFSETVTRSDGKFQQITLIDPVKRSLCVYHVNLMSGQIELRSARDIQWDLQLVYLNSKKPLPNEVQAVIQSSKRR